MKHNARKPNKDEKTVIRFLSNKKIKATTVPDKAGYDLKASKMLIEVKGRKKSPNWFAFSQNQMNAAKNKNYHLYWVQGTKIFEIPRKSVLRSKPTGQRRLILTKEMKSHRIK
jgi:hypothetical protein